MLSMFRADLRELSDGEEVNKSARFAKSPSREFQLSRSFRSITQSDEVQLLDAIQRSRWRK